MHKASKSMPWAATTQIPATAHTAPHLLMSIEEYPIDVDWERNGKAVSFFIRQKPFP